MIISFVHRVEGQHKVLKEALHSSTGDFCYVLDAIHRVNDCQMHDLQGSLEIDRFKWPTEAHELKLFDDIKRVVSKQCFDFMFAHYRKVVEGTISPECTDPIWRVVYGLPCPHEVQRWMETDTPIPPEEIHKFWKELTWELTWDREEHGLGLEIPFHSDEDECDADLHPPPKGTVQPKGRPRGSRGNPCSIRPIPSERFRMSDSGSAGIDWGHENVDPFMLRYIERVESTLPDGHCGFRSLAALVGPEAVMTFAQMRGLLCDHLQEYGGHYVGCYTGEFAFLDFVQNQRWTGPVNDMRYWIELPIMGLVFATLYQQPLVVLNWFEPFTCLPMFTNNPDSPPQIARLGIALVGNNDHFVPVSTILSLYHIIYL